jgi:hypothetical protein
VGVVTELSVEDVAELRRQGDFRDYLRQVAASEAEEELAPGPLAVVPSPGYRITHTGGWPLGTAATGPTPPPDTCTCAKCGGNPASRATHQPQAGEAA